MTITALLALVFFIGLLVAGLITLTIAAHGRWLVDVARCAACGQRVGQGEYERSGRCPECGFDIAAPRGIVYFRRRMRYGLASVGAGVGLLAFVAPLTLAATRSSRFTLGPASPTPQLIATLRDDSDGAGFVALMEAERRARAGELSAAELKDLADATIDWLESTDSTYLDSNAETVLTAAKAKGVDIDKRLVALADVLLEPPLADWPETVRAGASPGLALRLPISESAGSLGRTLTAATLTVDGAPADPTSQDLDLPPGDHVIDVRLTGSVTLANSTPGAPAVSVPIDLSVRRSVRVVPADAPPILPLFDDPAFEPTVRTLIDVRAVAIDFDSSSGTCVVRVDLAGDRNGDALHAPGAPREGSFALAYALVLEIESGGERQEYPLGRQTMAVEENQSSSSGSGGRMSIPCPPADARIRVLLRPTPQDAETTSALQAKSPVYVRPITVEPRILRNGPARPEGAR
ncbi:MAG: hypothetical protein JNM94_08790 [Phycisphaerae bacterium]|nr:hypothetical protein [Phycisphaerae bacterium]